MKIGSILSNIFKKSIVVQKTQTENKTIHQIIKIFSNHVLDKGLIPTLYSERLQFN